MFVRCRAAPNACKIQHFRACQAAETPSRSGAGPGPRRSAGPGLGLGLIDPGLGPVLTGVLEFDRGSGNLTGVLEFDRGFVNLTGVLGI